MVDIDYKKEYLPGYTGHVPKKNEIYGCTAGDINKIITKVAYKPSNYDVDISVGKPSYAQRDFYNNPPTQDYHAAPRPAPLAVYWLLGENEVCQVSVMYIFICF